MQNEIKTNVAASTENKLSDESKTVLGTTETTVTESKPAEPAKPATKAKRKPRKASGKNKTGKPAEKPATDEAVTNRGLARDAATVARQATNFDQTSDRDGAYLRFFGSVMRKHGGKATLAQIHEAGKADGKKRRNPYYTGSAKATDAGAINRLVKAGFIAFSDNGNVLRALKKATDSSDYNKIKI